MGLTSRCSLLTVSDTGERVAPTNTGVVNSLWDLGRRDLEGLTLADSLPSFVLLELKAPDGVVDSDGLAASHAPVICGQGRPTPIRSRPTIRRATPRGMSSTAPGATVVFTGQKPDPSIHPLNDPESRFGYRPRQSRESMAALTHLTAPLTARSGGQCELCEGTQGLVPAAVPPEGPIDVGRCLLLCEACTPQVAGGPLDGAHWRCLQGAIWSEVAAVQVVSWRLLHRLQAQHEWAQELLDQAYLEDNVLEWAKQAIGDEERVKTVDSNGTELNNGDAVSLIKALDIKGANFTAKRGTLVKNIRLTDDPGLVEGRVNKTGIVLKTEFLKRAT